MNTKNKDADPTIKTEPTIEEVRSLFVGVVYGGQAEELLIEKWDQLALTQLMSASTFREIREVFLKSRRGSAVRGTALERMIITAKTVDEMKQIISHVPVGGKTQKLLLDKMDLVYPKSRLG